MKQGSVNAEESKAGKQANTSARLPPAYARWAQEQYNRIPKSLRITAYCGLLFVLCAVLYRYGATHYARFGTDWITGYYPATIRLLQGKNPYDLTYLTTPPWLMVLLTPFALLGAKPGLAVMFFTAFGAFAYAAHRLGASPLSIVATLCSPVFILGIYGGNFDWLVLLGLLLPARIGLFLAVLKPQDSIAMVLYWAWKAWREGGLRKLALTFLPVIIGLAAAYAAFGNWLVGRSDDLPHSWWNMSLFPWSIPVGAVLLYIAIRRKRANAAIAASPCLSPYVNLGSWSVTLIGISDNQLAAVAISAGSWVLVLAGKMMGLSI